MTNFSVENCSTYITPQIVFPGDDGFEIYPQEDEDNDYVDIGGELMGSYIQRETLFEVYVL